MDPMQNNNLGNQSPVGMTYTGASMGIGGGDVVIAPEGKSKKWWIVGGVVGVLVIVALSALLLSVFFQNNVKMEAREAWDRYFSYLIYGENDESGNDLDDITVENWYPALIGTRYTQDDTDEGTNHYYDSLKEKYEEYFERFPQMVDGFLEYDMVFHGFYDYNTIKRLEKTVVDKYDENGVEMAGNYINTINDDVLDNNNYVGKMYSYIRMYLQEYLTVVDYYSERGCSYPESNNVNCPEIGSDNGVLEKLVTLHRVEDNMNYYYNNVYANYVLQNTLLINEQIGEAE